MHNQNKEDKPANIKNIPLLKCVNLRNISVPPEPCDPLDNKKTKPLAT